MDFSSFLTSLGTSFLVFVILVVVFVWLSGKAGNRVIYYPNRILNNMDPSVTTNPFAWIREAMSSTEQDILSISGLDTAVYFVFLSTVLGIFAISGVVLLPILLPVAATAHEIKKTLETVSNGTFTDLDRISMAMIGSNSPRLWVFLACIYWVSFVTYFLLWKAYKHVAELRADALMSAEGKPEQFALLVRDIPDAPEGQTTKDQVDSYFTSIYPDTFYRSMIVTNNSAVDKIWKELEGYKKKLARAEAIYAASKSEGARPTNKTGCLGLIGEKVDSIEYYTEQINETLPKLEAEQKVTLREKQQKASIVFFSSRVTAASAAQSLHAQMVDKWTVMEAPEPRQLIWANFHIKFFQRQMRQYIVYLIVAVTILFYLIPIGFISAFTTLGNLRRLLPFMEPVLKQSAVKTFLGAFLPQITLLVFLAVLPSFLLFLSKTEGIPSKSHAIRASSGKYFYFSVLNVFIGVTLAGTLYSTLKDIQNDPNSVPELLATSLPDNATFFLTFVALRLFVGYGLELSRLIPFIMFHLKRKYMCKTEAELKEAWFPGAFGYGTRVPSDMLILTIVLCYSCIAPIIIPFGVLYFGLGWVILRNQGLRVYVPSYESYGRMWPHMHIRILAALILYQATMFGYFITKRFPYTLVVLLLPVITLLFGYTCQKKFYRSFCHTALDVASQEMKEAPDMEQIFKEYIPRSLRRDKTEDGDHKDAFSRASRSAPEF